LTLLDVSMTMVGTASVGRVKIFICL